MIFLVFYLFIHYILNFEARSHVFTKVLFGVFFSLCSFSVLHPILVKRSASNHQYESCYTVSIACSYSFLRRSFITFSLALFLCLFVCIPLHAKFFSFHFTGMEKGIFHFIEVKVCNNYHFIIYLLQ